MLGPAVALTLTGAEADLSHTVLAADAAGTLVLSGAAHTLGRSSDDPSGGRYLAVAAVAVIVTMLTGLVWRAGPDTGWGAATGWASAVLAGVVVAHSTRVVALVAAASATLCAIASPAIGGIEEAHSEALLMSTVAAVALGVGAGVANQRRLAVAQRHAAVVGERQAMARELHDVIAHEISGIVVLAQAIGPQAQAGGVGPAVTRIEQAGVRALQQIRTLVATARAGEAPGQDDGAPPESPREASWRDTTRLVDAFAATTTAEVVRELPADDEPVDPALALAVHRIVAEALTNIRRHAATATTVGVRIHQGPGEWVITVTDDGFGGGLGAGSGAGLTGIRERAELVGGTARTGRSGGLWVVEARLPRSTGGALR